MARVLVPNGAVHVVHGAVVRNKIIHHDRSAGGVRNILSFNCRTILSFCNVVS